MIDWNAFLYGDGTGRPMGLLERPADKPLPPDTMTRQRRRAAERAARKAQR